MLATAHSETRRGWLVYPDGNRISGELTEQTGVFKSDRFGEVSYADGEVSFLPEESPAANTQSPDQTAGPVVEAVSEQTAVVDEATARIKWWPDNWSFTGFFLWKDDDGDSTFEAVLEIAAKWLRERDEVTFSLSSEYERENGEVDTNEQTGRVRWFHDLSGPFFTLAEGFLERDILTVEGTDYDYLFIQGAVGAGLQKEFSPRLSGRVALLWNQISIDILESSEGGTVDAFSLFTQLDWKIFEPLSLGFWGKLYFWEDSDIGFESQTELDYKLSRNFSVGLRYRYQEETASLSSETKSEMKVYTRLSF